MGELILTAHLVLLALPFLARIGLGIMRRGLAHLTLLLWLIVGAERGSRTENIEGVRLRWAELLPEFWAWAELLPELWAWAELRAESRRQRCCRVGLHHRR